ncbi:hypothetical protein ACFL1Q_00700 [Patescibacteria group bacterium]
MKKYIPFILLVVGVLVVIVAIFVVKKNISKGTVDEDEETAVEVPFSQRPFASLSPSSDGHWLTLKVENIIIEKASSMDYELLYSLPDGRTQGVPGTVSLDDESKIERELLLGSESSGKFRYDEGVEEGALTLRFRNTTGKLLTKFITKWYLQSGKTVLSVQDGDFSFDLAKISKDFFVVMQTFGMPAGSSVESVSAGPYGVFTSASVLPSGSAPEGWQKVGTNVFYK